MVGRRYPGDAGTCRSPCGSRKEVIMSRPPEPLPTYASHEQGWRHIQSLLPPALRLGGAGVPMPDEAWLDVGPYRVHLDCWRRPEAPATLVLVHGGGGNGRLLAPFGAMLAALGYEVLAPDLPGYGLTQVRNKRALVYDDWRDTLAAVLEAEAGRSRRPLVVFGASMGGMLAYDVTVRTRLPRRAGWRRASWGPRAGGAPSHGALAVDGGALGRHADGGALPDGPAAGAHAAGGEHARHLQLRGAVARHRRGPARGRDVDAGAVPPHVPRVRAARSTGVVRRVPRPAGPPGRGPVDAGLPVASLLREAADAEAAGDAGERRPLPGGGAGSHPAAPGPARLPRRARRRRTQRMSEHRS
ncbi:alpha/beta hydrolase [Pyxidicoccus sp. 3LG]